MQHCRMVCGSQRYTRRWQFLAIRRPNRFYPIKYSEATFGIKPKTQASSNPRRRSAHSKCLPILCLSYTFQVILHHTFHIIPSFRHFPQGEKHYIKVIFSSPLYGASYSFTSSPRISSIPMFRHISVFQDCQIALHVTPCICFELSRILTASHQILVSISFKTSNTVYSIRFLLIFLPITNGKSSEIRSSSFYKL